MIGWIWTTLSSLQKILTNRNSPTSSLFRWPWKIFIEKIYVFECPVDLYYNFFSQLICIENVSVSFCKRLYFSICYFVSYFVQAKPNKNPRIQKKSKHILPLRIQIWGFSIFSNGMSSTTTYRVFCNANLLVSVQISSLETISVAVWSTFSIVRKRS